MSLIWTSLFSNKNLDFCIVPLRPNFDLIHFFYRRATGNAGGANSQQLTKKKEELVSKISNKVEMLRVELQSLKSETKTNEEIGRQITVKVMQVAQPNECEKFKLHVEEIDKITSLLVGLAGRLAKAENSFSLCTDTTEKVKNQNQFLKNQFL